MEKARILIGIIGIIGIHIIPSTIARALNDSKIEQNADGRIICVLNYHRYEKLSASVSDTDEYDDFDTDYLLFDYKEFANSFDEFKERYPTFTMITRGEADSYLTFGDVGRNKFGASTYLTSTFDINNPIHNVNIVDSSDEKWLTYYVNVVIGVAFRKENTKLMVNPHISGTLTSHGFSTRDLTIGFTVETITFNPKNYE